MNLSVKLSNIDELQIRQTAAGLEIPLHVQPRARRCEIVGIHNRSLKIKVTAPPVDDAANRAIVDFFAELLAVPRSAIQIIAGLKSREKTLQVKGLSSETFLDRMASSR